MGLGLRFRMDRANKSSSQLHLLPFGFCLLFLIIDDRNLKVPTFKEDETDCIG
jgi:hypothetical protein